MDKSTIKNIIKTLKFYQGILKKGIKERNASKKAKLGLIYEIKKVDQLIEELKNEN